MLARPEWPTPIPSRRFVHRIGVIASRRRGRVEESPGDDVFCTAKRAIRLPTPKPIIQVNQADTAAKLPLQCAFRRLFYDGSALGRFEMGWACRRDETAVFSRDFQSLAADLLNHRAFVGSAVNRRTLASAGPSLAKLFIRASQPIKEANPAKNGIEARRPMILIEVPTAEPSAVAKLRELLWRQFDASLPRVFLGNVETKADSWRLAVLVGGTPETLRSVRLSLLRLHAEIEAIRFVSAEVISGRLPYEALGASGKRLLVFFETKAESIFRHDHGGTPVRPLLAMLVAGDANLHAFNLTDAKSLGDQATEQIQIAYRLRNRIKMTKIIQKGDHSNFGPVIVDSVVVESLNHSFNKIAGEKREDLKKLLEEFHETAKKAIASLPAAEQADSAADLDRFVDETKRNPPSKKFWEASRDGVIEATKTVAEIVPTLLPIATSIAKLLFG